MCSACARHVQCMCMHSWVTVPHRAVCACTNPLPHPKPKPKPTPKPTPTPTPKPTPKPKPSLSLSQLRHGLTMPSAPAEANTAAADGDAPCAEAGGAALGLVVTLSPAAALVVAVPRRVWSGSTLLFLRL